jgi:hypothetical protein
MTGQFSINIFRKLKNRYTQYLCETSLSQSGSTYTLVSGLLERGLSDGSVAAFKATAKTNLKEK